MTELKGRIGFTLYYGLVWVLAVRRCASIVSWRGSLLDPLSNLQMALYAGVALSAWWLFGRYTKASDRLAAFLFGLFYALRVIVHLVKNTSTPPAAAVECAVISTGMVAMIVGLKRAISREKQGNAHT